MSTSSPSPPGVYAPFIWLPGRVTGAVLPMNQRLPTCSMRERPDPHFFLAYAPQTGQTVWFHNQEKDNECTKNHVLDMRRCINRQRQSQHVRDIGEQHRQQHHEGGTEEAADD